MSDEVMIFVAPVPSEKQPEKFPGELHVAKELVRCHDAGAVLGHLHVRDRGGLQTSDPTLFERHIAHVHERCGMIVEGSTGGAPHHSRSDRCVSFRVPGVEVGSLNMGSVNMFDEVFRNPVPEIAYYASQLREHGVKPYLDCFDLSHVSYAGRFLGQASFAAPHLFGLVFDFPDALAYSDRHLQVMVDELPNRSLWVLHRYHARGARAFQRALELGGHVRVGFEDGPFLGAGRRARSNAELVPSGGAGAQWRGGWARGRHCARPRAARAASGASVAGDTPVPVSASLRRKSGIDTSSWCSSPREPDAAIVRHRACSRVNCGWHAVHTRAPRPPA